MKKNIYIAVLGILLSNAIGYFLLFSEQQQRIDFELKDVVFTSICGLLITFFVKLISTKLNYFFPYKTQIGNRLFVGFVVNFSVSFLITFAIVYCYKYIYFDVNYFFKKTSNMLIKLAIIFCILSIIFEVIYFALYSYYSFSKFQIEQIKQERKQTELQLKALKTQLSPHFLFNCLNTVSSLIYKNESKATKFIRRLAKLYDFTLKSYESKLISLQQELEFVESYVYLMQSRFENKFKCNIEIDNTLLKTKIPPLTLQMLVENTLKHNQLSLEKPLNIRLFNSENELIVENSILKCNSEVTSFNVGLKNINSRYLILVNKSITTTNGEKFTVKVPILK